MSVQHTPGPWHVSPAIGHPGRLRVQRKAGGAIEILRSASGRFSIFKTSAAAARAAKGANAKATGGSA